MTSQLLNEAPAKDFSDTDAQVKSVVDEASTTTSTEVQSALPSTSTETKPPQSTISTEPQASPKSENTEPNQIDGAGEARGGSVGIHDANYSVSVTLADMQANPNDPLYSIKSFEELGLSENILKGIYQMRFTKPSKIQERALPLLLTNPPMNMIGQSQSGTGKTAAFVLNILSRLDLTSPELINVPQALCLAPTRELARQIIGVVQMMGAFMPGLVVSPAIPMDITNRGKELKGQIVVGTPGTVVDLLRKRLIKSDQIKVLVLDEADTMLDMQGLGDQCIRVMRMLPQTVQRVLFSATFPSRVTNYAEKFAPRANQITLEHQELTVEGIRQFYFDCKDEDVKYEVLLQLYGLMTVGSSIIFVKTRATAERIEKRMIEGGHKVASLTGALDPIQRDAIIDDFRDGRAKVLLATNVLARGIDVQTVSMVVNYDMPMDVHGKPEPEVFLHRVGRTGRFGRVGVSISLVHDAASLGALESIANYFAMPLTAVDHTDWDGVEKLVKHVIKSSRAQAGFNSA